MAERSLQERLQRQVPLWEAWLAEGRWEDLTEALGRVNRELQGQVPALDEGWLPRLQALLAGMEARRNQMAQKLGGVHQNKRSMDGYRPSRDGSYYLDLSE